MRNDYANWTRNAWLVSVRLILCLAMLYSTNSTGCTMDSLKRLDPKPIRLTEAGARQVLKDKADLILLIGKVQSQDTLLAQQQQALTSQGQTIKQLNEGKQQEKNRVTTAQSQTDAYRKKLRAARLENWITRGAVLLYVVVRLKLI
ncbi:hypothetical protein M0L20_13555 [Spirosoma sp. RP8]|uniref:Uncharacterized protein n=1 Tax=Spirosoma liriopis TaxID=2937440 RepID=A0ABT0HL75_9BACT|nr:hypothetical protein [Spirosoma liriopis]MCK8492888.1 hypothetical protein [Spirosoma liriopis]